MQQLAKSFGSLSWALPLFGLQQMTNALRRSEDGMLGGDAVAAFDAVTRASIEQCGTRMRETFEVGDKMQRDIVDMMFRLVPIGGAGCCTQESGTSGMPDMMNPMQMMRRFTGRPDDAVQQQAQTPQRAQQQVPQPAGRELGWGPVPPIN